MLPLVQIKLEPDEDRREPSPKKKKKKEKSSLASPKCTCTPHSVSGEKFPLNSSKHRQILVNFGLRRRKIFNLKSKKDNIYQIFSSFVSGEPAFSKLLDNAYVVLQEYNSKFGTYVDVDDSEHLRDGSVLKAVFFPTGLERDDQNPGCIKTVERKSFENSSGDCIQIDSSENDEEVDSSSSNKSDETSTLLQVQLAPKHNSEKRSRGRKSCDEDEDPEGQLPPKQCSEKRSKQKRSYDEGSHTGQLPPKHCSEKSKQKLSYDGDTSEVQLPPKQYSGEKSRREDKKHCLEEQWNIPQECREGKSEPCKNFKIENNSEKDLPLAKSTCEVPNNQHRPKPLLPTWMTKGTNIGSPPGSSTRDRIPFSNGSRLDSAVSQNCNQTGRDQFRYQSKQKASSQMDLCEGLPDPVTRLAKLCVREMITPPKYRVVSLTYPKCTVIVDGNLYSGSGAIIQSAKQNAASVALRHLLGTFSKKETDKKNEQIEEKRTGKIEELSVYSKGERVPSENVNDTRSGGGSRCEEGKVGWNQRGGRGEGYGWRGRRSWKKKKKKNGTYGQK